MSWSGLRYQIPLETTLNSACNPKVYLAWRILTLTVASAQHSHHKFSFDTGTLLSVTHNILNKAATPG